MRTAFARAVAAACTIGLLAAVGAPGAMAVEADGLLGYYRYPSLHEETVVFVAEGDLWVVGIEGGRAARLTTHLDAEGSPAISPDGERVAFTASYEGPQEVYVMPLTGGLPRRLTYHGSGARVVGWTPDGRILYATQHYATLPSTQLVALDPATGIDERLELAQAAEGVYTPDGDALIFTRLARQYSHTRGYRGGTAQSLWRFELRGPQAGDEATPLTADYPGTSRNPMWHAGRVYFVSDRDGTMNLWSMAPDGADLRRHTRHMGWDVKDPSLSAGRIVYRLGADLRLYEIGSERDRRIEISLSTDLDQARERWIEDPIEHLSDVYLSPDGDRLALTAYGQVFVAPVGQGRLVAATRDTGVRYRSARFTPDGASLLVLSDASGEVEWWRLPADGTSPGEQLSDDGSVLRFGGVASPDGDHIAYTDHDQRLWVLDIAAGRNILVAESPQWGVGDPAWSPDSRYLAYSLEAPNSFPRIQVYDLARERSVPVTTDRYRSWSPCFSPDGEWLYFLSDRTFRSRVGGPWGLRQPEPYFDETTRIYLLPLEPDSRSPFAPADELHPEPEGRDGAARGNDPEETRNDEESEVPRVRIDFDRIAERLRVAPVEAGNYTHLSVSEKHLFWLARTADSQEGHALQALPIDNDEPEPVTIAEGVKSYELSLDGRKLLLRRGDAFHVIKADSDEAPGADDHKERVDLSGWKFSLDPREQWRQMFVESWRLERDYFYDPGMHGLDWEAVLQKYLPLIDRVTTRAELADLQAQMAAELGALHTGVWGGDHREGEIKVETASLGAVLSRDDDAGGYRVTHIYRADPDRPEELSPLARPASRARVGDLLRTINGVALTGVDAPERLLRGQAGHQVRLGITTREGRKRDLIVEPISSGRLRDLRYDEWEVTRRLMVDSLGAGEIGYVHLRDMGSSDMAQWHRDYYPVFNRRGLIIDVRHNGGGNIDSWILARLLRRAWMYWQPRTGAPYWNMQYAFRGHMVVLVDEWTMSDGEAFAEGFRRLGLGKVIGTRTWGGEIWLTSSNRLVDRGIVTAAEFGVYGPEGEWLIEGHGVEPDIVVDNLPHATFLGQDAQLRTAIAHLQELIREDPRDVPPPPPYPSKAGGR